MDRPDTSLTVSFAGIALNSPIIAASAPPTESAAAMLACAKAGAGAVVTKSTVDYSRSDWPDMPRRAMRNRRGLWIQGSFASETLTLDEGSAIIAETRQATDIPIIASVGVLDPSTDEPIETALRLVGAGANMVHFDLFYLPQPRCTDAVVTCLRDLFLRAGKALPVPFGPKLNADIPVHRFAADFPPDLFDGIFLLDSIRVPPPLLMTGEPRINAWHGGLECSLFGEWQKPITLQYARVLADAGMPPICAGGGLRNAADVLEVVLLGATCAQMATQIMIHGYDWIRRTNDELAALLAREHFGNITEARGLALQGRNRLAPEHVSPVRAVVNASKCKPCGVCSTLAFCSFIEAQADGVPVIDEACYGCGFCELFCPHDGAIRMERVS